MHVWYLTLHMLWEVIAGHAMYSAIPTNLPETKNRTNYLKKAGLLV